MNKPRVSLIWAEDHHHVIGRGNALPWHIPADMAWFRQQTMGKPILMGRKTHESIGRALPGRINIIQSRTPREWGEHCVAVCSIDEALQAAAAHDELMIMGGAQIYQLWLPYAERLIVTHVEGSFEGDVVFPSPIGAEWRCVYEQRNEESIPCRFCMYEHEI